MSSSHPDYPAAIQRDQNLISLVQCNEAFRFYIPVLVGVSQLNRHQLEIHPAILHCIIVATLVYCLTFSAYTKLNIHHTRNNSQLFGIMAFIWGFLSSALLVYNLVPRLIGCIILISWALLSILVVHQHAPLNNKETYEMLGQKMKNIKIPEKISSIWSKNEPGLPRDG